MKRRTAMGKNRISNRGSDRNGDRNGGSNGGSGNSGARAGKRFYAEPLERRRYLSIGDDIGLPLLNLDIPGNASTTVASPTTKQLDIKATGTTGFDRLGVPFSFPATAPAIVEIHLIVNNDGTLNNTVPGDDLIIYQDNDNSGGLSAGDTTLLTGEIFSFLSTNITTEFHFDTNENSGLWSTSTSFFGTGTPNSLDVGIQLDLSGPVIPLDYATGFSGYLPKGVLGSLPHQINLPPGQLSGFAYEDCGAVATSNNGVFDAGENPIANVSIELLDATNTVIQTTTTDVTGFYSFTGLLPGTYSIHEVQPAGFLDGKDTIGTQGGSTSNDLFYNITVVGGTDGMNNNFGELDPASLSGFVYDDLNNNGLFEPPIEEGIPGVTVTLTGTDDLGNVVGPIAHVTDSTGAYSFTNLRPGTYVLTETQPAGFADGKDTIGTQGGDTSNDKFSNIQLSCGVNGIKNNFGEMGLLHSQTATIGFWRNMNGQRLIQLFNTTTAAQFGTSKSLGNWLATNFPKIYSGSTNPNNFAGKTTAQIAARFAYLFDNTMGQKLDLQVLGLCLSIYATTKELNSTFLGQDFATKHGFTLTSQSSASNLRNRTWNVGSNGEAFATKVGSVYVTADNQTLSIWTLLQRTNGFAVNGVLWASSLTIGGVVYTSQTLRNEGNVVFSAINQAGDII